MGRGGTFGGGTIVIPYLGSPKIRHTFVEGPHSKDYSVLGSFLGSPYFGRLPYWDSTGAKRSCVGSVAEVVVSCLKQVRPFESPYSSRA